MTDLTWACAAETRHRRREGINEEWTSERGEAGGVVSIAGVGTRGKYMDPERCRGHD
jgi:hypothetical protein